MARIKIVSMPRSYLKIKPIYRPLPPPVFKNSPPTEEDVELARELFQALDEPSKAWYRQAGGRRIFDEES